MTTFAASKREELNIKTTWPKRWARRHTTFPTQGEKKRDAFAEGRSYPHRLPPTGDCLKTKRNFAAYKDML